MSKNDRDSFKIIILGEAGVGKSSLVRRYAQGTFCSRTTTTVGVDRIPITVGVDDEELQFQVLDAAGSFGFRGLIKSYMTNIDAVVFMYDISNKESFAALPLWTTLLKNTPATQNITKVLVGNKKDKISATNLASVSNRQVKFKNAKNYAEFEGMISLEISVKEEESVDLVFQCIARELKLKRRLAESALTKGVKKETMAPSGGLADKRFYTVSSSQDFIDYDDSADSSPKQFARKLSMLITGRNRNKKLQRQQQIQQQQLQRQRKTSEPSDAMYSLKTTKDDPKRDEKRYLLWY